MYSEENQKNFFPIIRYTLYSCSAYLQIGVHFSTEAGIIDFFLFKVSKLALEALLASDKMNTVDKIDGA